MQKIILTIFVSVIAFMTFYIAYTILKEKQLDYVQQDFTYIVDHQHGLVVNEFERHKEFVIMLSNFKKASSRIDPDEFESFIAPYFKLSNAVLATGFINFDVEKQTLDWDMSSSSFLNNSGPLSDALVSYLNQKDIHSEWSMHAVQPSDLYVQSSVLPKGNFYDLLVTAPIFDLKTNIFLGYAYSIVNVADFVNDALLNKSLSFYSLEGYAPVIGSDEHEVTVTVNMDEATDLFTLKRSFFVHDKELYGLYYPSSFFRDHYITSYPLYTSLSISAIISALIGLFLLYGSNLRSLGEVRLAQAKARRSEQILETIFDHLPLVVYAKDVQNEYRLKFFNKEAVKFFDQPRDFMLGKKDHDLWAPEEADFFHAKDIEVISTKIVVDIPSELVTVNGQERYLHTRKVPIFDDSGEPILLLGCSLDITERMKNEKELEAYRNELEQMVQDRTKKLEAAVEKAQELSRLKSDFLATMSHEIRTPMNGILGMAELIQGARPNAQIESYAKTIINSGETLQQIIDDILDFSKIEAGKIEFDNMSVNLLDLVDDLANLHSVKARDNALELVVRYVPGSEQFVFADPVRLRQVLGNLISNAIKFTHKGHVIISVEEIKDADIPKDKALMKFSVEDTGIGMSEEAQSKIFEKFQQADNSTTRQYGGTGLGLSISKSLIELMGGEIAVESEVDKGSIFSFTVSLTRNESEAVTLAKPPILKDLRLLVVDDLPVILQLVSEQLLAAGIRCECAGSGDEALEMMKKAAEENDPYKIALIDYLMPNMNGEMLSASISDDELINDTCLIMLTAAGNPLADDKFSEKGFSSYIAKPVNGPSLINSLAYVWEKYDSGIKDILISVDAHHTHEDAEKSVNAAMDGINILVAEDNIVNQVFIKEVLEDLEVEYEIVSNGEEAVEAVKAKTYDLIMMDCLMPVMDGFEATRTIKGLISNGDIKPLPICALTANAMKGDREKCLAAGMDDYLSKPVRKKELTNKIMSLLKLSTEAGQSDVDANGHVQEEGTAKVDEPPVQLQDVDDEPLLDEDAVANARSILKDKYSGMVEVYITNSWERVEEIEKAIGDLDVEAAIRPAHTLKSTSKQMGALKLSDVAKELEYCAKAMHKDEEAEDVSMDSLSGYLNQIRDLLARTKKAFEEQAE